MIPTANFLEGKLFLQALYEIDKCSNLEELITQNTSKNGSKIGIRAKAVIDGSHAYLCIYPSARFPAIARVYPKPDGQQCCYRTY